MANRSSPLMGAPPTRRSQVVKLPTASGVIPAPTHAASLRGCCQCGLASAFAFGATRSVLPTSGADPLVQDGYMVELLPKLAFFTLWDRPPSDRLAGSGSQDSSVGRLPIGSPPPADPAIPAELIGGGSTPPVSRPLHRHMLTWPRTWLPSSWASLILRGLHSFQSLADYRSLADPTVATRTLLAQINYIVDVTANMPPNTHTTANGVFRLAWRVKETDFHDDCSSPENGQHVPPSAGGLVLTQSA